jgi:phosphoribosylaminoimidazolecarboxamide formyltransferase/IMP cyclohydrolase
MATASHQALALLSVTDKTGIVEFARELHKLQVGILSTGGTAKLLMEAGIPVTEVSQHTGSPEILDGRVKTLHPKVHGGILFDRSKPSHVAQCQEFGIRPIDLVVVNLYQFESKALKEQLGLESAIEHIDIGGPCMLRAAAKNFAHCAPVIDPRDYERVLVEWKAGGLSAAFRRELAAKTFRAISRYDAMIAAYFERASENETAELAPSFPLDLSLQQTLRYGENPHQKAGFYRSPFSQPGGLQDARVVQGKELSFNNLLDCDAAAQIVADFPESLACTIIKHTNPCGTALGRPGESLLEIYQRALSVDPKSAFGGIVAFNVPVDGPTAEALSQLFLECIVAPGYSAAALQVLAAKKNLRVLELPYLAQRGGDQKQWDLRSVLGGVLLQERDQVRTDAGQWQVVTKKAPTPTEVQDLVFAMRLCKHVKSNAIVFARDLMSVAVGAGQMSRVDSATFAAEKAREFGRSINNTVLASDAFFPFRDTVDLAAKLGVTAIVQPGGSMRDAESIAAADEQGLAMVFTGVRHFKH